MERFNSNGKIFIDADTITLDDWLSYVIGEKKADNILITNTDFPDDTLYEFYLEHHINNQKSDDVWALVQVLLGENDISWFKANLERSPDSFAWMLQNIKHIFKNCECPERVSTILYKYFIVRNHDPSCLADIKPRDFENLVARLYEKMGYETRITPQTRDGGYDILVWKNSYGYVDKAIIECKRFLTSNVVGVRMLRNLEWTLKMVKKEHPDLSRIIVVTSSTFTPSAFKEGEENYVQLIDFKMFDRMMNDHFGADWNEYLDHIIMTDEYVEKLAEAAEAVKQASEEETYEEEAPEEDIPFGSDDIPF